MSIKYSQSFKASIVEKVLNRGPDVTIEDIVNQYGVSQASITRWRQAAQQQEQQPKMKPSQEEKRPQDWSPTERLQALMDCGNLDEQGINTYCREQGIYPHHIHQWKMEFISPKDVKTTAGDQVQLKHLKAENKNLQQELRRKEKALAEAAALLVLKKKAQTFWGNDEDNT